MVNKVVPYAGETWCVGSGVLRSDVQKADAMDGIRESQSSMLRHGDGAERSFTPNGDQEAQALGSQERKEPPSATEDWMDTVQCTCGESISDVDEMASGPGDVSSASGNASSENEPGSSSSPEPVQRRRNRSSRSASKPVATEDQKCHNELCSEDHAPKRPRRGLGNIPLCTSCSDSYKASHGKAQEDESEEWEDDLCNICRRLIAAYPNDKPPTRPTSAEISSMDIVSHAEMNALAYRWFRYLYPDHNPMLDDVRPDIADDNYWDMTTLETRAECRGRGISKQDSESGNARTLVP
ncbi:hypothetical protein DOTSEDRAFT_82602 [Dothistroma septosporum NZE10]|uniref:Uncharacterized protein n=1 Tax=Dothistroma septosporum (strain NZE10 / CBS 128990) TaxID=675120 RepID=N1PEU4_DOTSN|nr:hypothetical protein DOTSEDRAFT_82602 [Dothistroma septosporum NZE10]